MPAASVKASTVHSPGNRIVDMIETGEGDINSSLIHRETGKTVQTAKTSQGPIFTPQYGASNLVNAEYMNSFTNDRFSNIMNANKRPMRFEKRPLE